MDLRSWIDSQGVVTASQDADSEQNRQRHLILESHLQIIRRKWKRET